MAIHGTVEIGGTIAPFSENDSYAVTDQKWGKDGLRNVDSLAERNAITAERRKAGMLVGVNDGGAISYYKLLDVEWNYTDADWEEFMSDAATKDSHTSMLQVGNIQPQQVIQAGTTLDQFINKLLLTTFYPAMNAPSFSLTTNQAAAIESGTIENITITYNFSRGSIVGKMVSGIWQPSTFQAYRTGTASDYVINGADMLLVNNRTISNFRVVDGANTFSGLISYNPGDQAVDSDGANYLTPLPSGQHSDTVTITGYRRLFYGVSNLAVSSALIRSLGSSSLAPVNGTAFTIHIPVGATNVVIAYPATLRDLTSVQYVEGLYAEVKDNFVKTTVNVEGASGYASVSYKVYIYTPVEPFGATATYNAII